MDERDYFEELKRQQAKEDAINAALHAKHEAELEAKRELKYAIKHRSLQRNGSFAARMNDSKTKGYRARANLRGKQR